MIAYNNPEEFAKNLWALLDEVDTREFPHYNCDVYRTGANYMAGCTYNHPFQDNAARAQECADYLTGLTGGSYDVQVNEGIIIDDHVVVLQD